MLCAGKVMPTFDSLIKLCLLEPQKLLTWIHEEGFKCVILDEAHDCCDAGAEFFYTVLRDGLAGIMLCDPRQEIYHFAVRKALSRNASTCFGCPAFAVSNTSLWSRVRRGSLLHDAVSDGRAFDHEVSWDAQNWSGWFSELG